MVTGKVFLLVLLVILQDIVPQSLGHAASRSADTQNSRLILKALYRDESPCSTDDCNDYGVPDSNSKYPEVSHTEGYEPQSHPEPEPADPEPLEQEPEEAHDPAHPEAGYEEQTQEEELVEVALCRNLMLTVEALESENPDLAPVKVKVLDDLIKYTWAYGRDPEDEDCDPAVQLLNMIITAARNLREYYRSVPDYQCQSTETYVEYTTETPEEQGYEATKEDYEHSTTQPYPQFPEVPEMSTEYHHEEVTKDEPCPEESVTDRYEPPVEKPCDDQEEEEVIAEVDEVYEHHQPSPHFVGSVRGVPGEHYPNYTEIPITSFSCADKCIPGFYADLQTGCQVFHVCYEHRRESFLCPLGTIFNQPIMACDFWYSSNCSLAPTYYDVNCKSEEYTKTEVDTAVVTSIVADKVDHQVPEETHEISEETLDELSQFLPVKAKVTVFSKTDEQAQSEDVEEVADQIFDKIITTATHTVSKTRDVIAKLPEPVETEVKVQFKKPVPVYQPKFVKVLPKSKVMSKVLAAKSAVPVAKFVVAKAAVPVVKTKVVAKAALPVVAKAKIVASKAIAAKAAVPVVAAAKVVAGKAVAAKAAVPVLATAKVVAGKAIAAKAAVPVVAKAKVVSGKTIAAKAAVPVVVKAKVAAAAVPVAKVAATKVIVAGGNVIAAKVAVPVVKTKAVVAAKVAAPAAAAVVAKKVVVPAKAAAATTVVKAAAIKGPALKTKILAASLPFGKAAILKASVPAAAATAKLAPALKVKLASVPVVKGKMVALPLAKGKVLAVAPLVKAKVVKAAVISPLTKKALALGYMKLLKAKKLALMG